MNKLPNEMLLNILSFLSVSDLKVVSKNLLSVYNSNIIWKPLFSKKFGEMNSTNFFKEYVWYEKLKNHQMSYKKQWTLGCVGRIMPLAKDEWMPAEF
jgi:hypothetical protein